MRSRRLFAGLSVAAALTVPVTAAGTAEAAPSSPSGVAIVCVPEAPVCYGITGNPSQGYRYWFRFTPRPASPSLSFTVNGTQAHGLLTTSSSPTSLSGEFRPQPPLVSGDTVCMVVGFTPNGYCETVA
jgi:hypothetical protein